MSRLFVPALFFFFVAACGTKATTASSTDTASEDASAVDTNAADTPAAVTEYVATLADFDCIKNGTKVGHFYVSNKLGHQAEAEAVAKGNVAGQDYPLGTIIRLFPLEAMVKRGGSAFADTNGWEMFLLTHTDQGNVISARGGVEVKNSAGSCVSCHSPAKSFDFVCGTTHGCKPLGATDELVSALQETDPLCP